MQEEFQPDKDKLVKIYTKYDVCGKCKGACCKSYAGIYAPEDFGNNISVDYITALLLTKRFVIDFNDAIYATDNVPTVTEKNYFIRPRHVDEAVLEVSRSGVCINWSHNSGCSLSEEKRPYQCRMLVPLIEYGTPCKYKSEDKASEPDMAERWKSYQHIIKDAKRRFKVLATIITIDETEMRGDIDALIESIKFKIKALYEKDEEI